MARWHVVLGRTWVGVVLVVAISCWLPNMAGAEKVVLRHLGFVWHGDPWHQYMDARIAEFEKLHPDVKIERIIGGAPGTGSMTDKLMAMIAGGIAPDVTEFTLGDGGALAPQGIFADLRPFIAKDKSFRLSDFAQVAVRAVTWVDGTLWGMPMDVYPVGTYYNQNLFNQAGLLTPTQVGESGWTWDYAMKAAKKITRDTNGDGKTDTWGIDSAFQIVNYQQPVKQAGGSWYDRHVDPTRATLTDPRTVQGFDWIAEFYREGLNAPDYDISFEHGLSGFSFSCGPTWIGTLNSVAKFDWDLASPVMGPDNNGGYVAVNSVQMTKYTKHAELAWEWMKFLAADRDNMQDFIRRTTRIPAITSMLPQYAKLIQRPPAGINTLSDLIMNPKSYHQPLGPTTARLNTLIFNAFMQQVVQENKGVQPVMESLTSQVNAILDEGRQVK